MSNLLREGERLDDLQRSNLQIIQNPAKFCFGMDAVLLSGFVTVKKGENVLDLGTGTGSFRSCYPRRRRAATSPGWKSRRKWRRWRIGASA